MKQENVSTVYKVNAGFMRRDVDGSIHGPFSSSGEATQFKKPYEKKPSKGGVFSKSKQTAFKDSNSFSTKKETKESSLSAKSTDKESTTAKNTKLPSAD